MKTFQIVVFTAVLFANIHWQILKNGYAASIIAGMMAYAATVILFNAVAAGYLGRRAARRLGLPAAPPVARVAAGNSGY